MLARDWYYNERNRMGIEPAVASIYDAHDDADMRGTRLHVCKQKRQISGIRSYTVSRGSSWPPPRSTNAVPAECLQSDLKHVNLKAQESIPGPRASRNSHGYFRPTPRRTQNSTSG